LAGWQRRFGAFGVLGDITPLVFVILVKLKGFITTGSGVFVVLVAF